MRNDLKVFHSNSARFVFDFEAMRYEENYQTALDSYQRSLALDPSFVSAKQQMNHLLSYLPLIYENVMRKVNIFDCFTNSDTWQIFRF